jgi:hypothetical protein
LAVQRGVQAVLKELSQEQVQSLSAVQLPTEFNLEQLRQSVQVMQSSATERHASPDTETVDAAVEHLTEVGLRTVKLMLTDATKVMGVAGALRQELAEHALFEMEDVRFFRFPFMS